MNTNEPTTGEIVRALRDCNAIDDCTACRKLGIKSDCTTLELLAADRLESQEREIMEKDICIEGLKQRGEALENDAINFDMNLAEATARAESAEKERDAAIAVIGIQAEKLKESHVVLCNICEFEDMIGCVHKSHCDGYQLFKWSGQPQEGEGK